MINFVLTEEEKELLKGLVGKTIDKFKHDPLDKFEGETVYGNIELFFTDAIIKIGYDYEKYPIFGSEDDDHPKFSIKQIKEEEATSALEGVKQIDLKCGQSIVGIKLVEDHATVEWNEKRDDVKILKAIILKLEDFEIAFQGDYMIPLIDIFKGDDVISKLDKPGYEFEGDQEINLKVKRVIVDL